MKKKLLAAFMAAAMLLTGCSGNTSSGSSAANDASSTADNAASVKAGFVYIGKIDDGGYTQAHDQGRLAIEKMGVETAYVEDVAETVSDTCEAIRTLIDEGCNLIYTNSFGFMEGTVEMAKEYPNVKFAHCSGYQRSDNLSTYFGKVYQARYLAGIVAGMKTEKNYIGYVAAKGIPEVIRGINAFTLGVQSVNPDAKIEVVFTDTWYDPSVEKQAALELLNKGVDVIAQHQDTTAPQVAAQEKGAYCIGYNFPTADAAPDAYLTAACFNWSTFYTDDCQRALDGTWTSRAYWEGLAAEHDLPRRPHRALRRGNSGEGRRCKGFHHRRFLRPVHRSALRSERRAQGRGRRQNDRRRDLEHELVRSGRCWLYPRIITTEHRQTQAA